MTARGVALSLALFAAVPQEVCGQQAQSPLTTSPRPALESFDRELQTLFADAQSRIVRVQVPVYISTDHPLFRWRAQLDPRLREQIARGEAPRLYVEPTTAPSTTPSAGPATAPGATQATQPDSQRVPLPPATVVLNVEYVGLVLNDRGDVLLPLHIDRASLNGRPLSVSLDDGSATSAQVVAADPKTSLTVVRLDAPLGEPVRFARQRPAMGSLVLMISPARRAARLAVWAGGQDDNAILFNRDGDVAGIVRNGHGLYTSTLTPIIEQLLAGQEIRRAVLGVKIREVPPDDDRRQQQTALGSRPAARVEDVLPDSAAARGGLLPGDLILMLAGEPVEDVVTFAAAIANRRGRTELLILRDGEERTVAVDLQPK
jgi:S1-C subfamily serine protease